MRKIKILVIGSGGREDSLCCALSQSPNLQALYIAPGNAGTLRWGDNVALHSDDKQIIKNFCEDKKIDLVVIGPEAPLVAGLSDDLRAWGINVFGPSKAAARIEGSKIWMKKLLKRHHIPTADFNIFDTAQAAYDWIDTHPAPYVIKADGLAAGKGVSVVFDRPSACEAVQAMMEDKIFGQAGSKIIIEEMMQGKELSFFLLCDGTDILPFGSARDYKRAFENDKGPNTGGMGAFSPAGECSPAMEKRIMDEIAQPLIAAMQQENCPYQGVMFLGLMLTKTGPRVIEINARFGDPECQILMMRLESDILTLLEDCARGKLGKRDIAWRKQAAVLFVLAAQGYPGLVKKDLPLPDLSAIEKIEHVRLYHAGTKNIEGCLFSSGGRVLNVAALGDDLQQARGRALSALDLIGWQHGFFRRDIAATKE